MPIVAYGFDICVKDRIYTQEIDVDVKGIVFNNVVKRQAMNIFIIITSINITYSSILKLVKKFFHSLGL